MHSLFIFALIFAAIKLLKEALEKPAPKGTQFVWDTYCKDIDNGIGAMEQVKKTTWRIQLQNE